MGKKKRQSAARRQLIASAAANAHNASVVAGAANAVSSFAVPAVHNSGLGAAGAATNGAAAAPRYAPASTARPHTSGAPFLHPPHHLVPSTLPTAATPCPPGWQTALDVCRATGSSYECVPIDKTSREYRVLESWIAATVSSTATSYPQISGIQRILNPNLWEAFENTRRAMLRTQSGHLGLLQELGVNRNAAQAQAMHSSTTLPPYHDNMVLLFHCTRGNISSVFEEGLDHRLGLGGLLGKGTYFADCPDKSMAYDGHRTLLVYAVLLGDCRWFPATNGSLTREPRKELDHRRRPGDVAFDSIVGRPASHNEYVVYKQDRCVPLYAVSYTAVNGKTSVATSSQSDHYQFASRFNEMEEPKPAIMNANVSALGKQSSSGAILLEDKDDTIDLDADDMIDLDAFTTASDPELGANLSVLNDLGFTDDPQSMKLLNECHGDLNLVIAHYCKMADDDKDEDEDEGGFVSIAYGSTTSWSQSSSRRRKTNPARQRKRSACGKFLSGLPVIDLTEDDKGSTSKGKGKAAMATVDLTSDTDDQNEYRHDGANKRSRVDLSATSSCSSSSTSIPPALPSKEMCDICADEFTADDDLLWQVLRCKHKLCTACFCILSKTGSSMSGRSLSYCKCPFCNAVDGIEFGTCPDGTMTVTREKRALPGHPGCDTIVIEYRITESPYNELRNAFLPDDTEGQRVLELLKKAWDRRLIMALGHSATRNQSNIPVWNVHHKTARNGGPPCYGYPDPTYLARVTQELRERGVV